MRLPQMLRGMTGHDRPWAWRFRPRATLCGMNNRPTSLELAHAAAAIAQAFAAVAQAKEAAIRNNTTNSPNTVEERSIAIGWANDAADMYERAKAGK